MHQAYEVVPILEKLPRQIDSIASNNDTLFVGTRDGHLLVYNVRGTNGRNDPPYDINLDRSNKHFTKGKAILQMEVVPEFHILIAIAEDTVSVYDLTVYAQITLLNRTRGATSFILDMKKESSTSGETQYNLRMCVAVKRNLQLYHWKLRDFHKLYNDLACPDVPKAIAWVGESICVGFKKEYYLIKIANGESKELFTTGKQMEPVITRLPDGRIALLRDESTVFVDENGNPTQKMALTWSSMPQAMVFSAPYLIGIMASCVEVRTIEPRLLIQSSEVAKPKLIYCRESDQQTIYIASNNYVWRLASAPLTTQIKQLLANKQFELALFLADMMDESSSERQQRRHSIRTLLAFDLFCQRRFDESLNVFSELGTDPSQVIGLFPNLLPDEFCKQLRYPDQLPDLEPSELEKGLLCLIDYLIKKRREILSDGFSEITTTAIIEGNTVMRSRRQLSQIVDTTLLKCYVQTNDALVAPLLRLADNNCHIEESERVLKKHQKYADLIVLYEKKGMHDKALELLLKQSRRPNSVLRGCDSTIQYLQKLGPEKIELIFDYSVWVIEASPRDGLTIFTEDLDEVRALPRQDVYNFLERTDKRLVIPYIEHVIKEWGDTTMQFHNLYATQLMQKIAELSGSNSSQGKADSLDTCSREDLRTKLNKFLLSSKCYSAESILGSIPEEGDFFEERAVVLGRLGRHEKALTIYVHILRDSEKALRYCHHTYDGQLTGYKDVYFHLLKMYLYPPADPRALVFGNPHHYVELNPFEESTTHLSASSIYIEEALKLLRDYPTKFNPIKVLNVLPDDVHLSDILTFLESALGTSTATRWHGLVLKGLLYAKRLQIEERRMYCYRNSFVVTDEMTCSLCGSKIANSAFSRIPPSDIVHLCCKDEFLRRQAAASQPAWESVQPTTKDRT